MLGRSLGNYGVVSKIGEGGMGVVYLARHATLGRLAAIKVLRPEMSSNQETVSRFFNEARAATAVRHSGIVEVFDFGFLEDRTAYIIMEYLEGESLAARLRSCRPSIAVTFTIVRAIARALQAVHEQGIIHRDLKPDNVFLVPDPELPSGERVKILDFGIAKLAPRVGEASHTQSGTVMGTPTYMSPEQCSGAGQVDHRADLYALGCIAYEMLCGRPPFVADGPGVVLARHLYMEPPALRSHRAEIPAEIEEIVLRLLNKEPRDRYTNAAALVRAIDQLAMVTPPVPSSGKSVPTEQVATLPLVRERTTLNGAASSREVPRQHADRSRVTLLAAAAAFTIVFLVVIVFLVRGGGDDETSPNAAAALPIESRVPDVASGAAPASSAPTPIVPAPAPVPPPAQAPTSPAPDAALGSPASSSDTATPTHSQDRSLSSVNRAEAPVDDAGISPGSQTPTDTTSPEVPRSVGPGAPARRLTKREAGKPTRSTRVPAGSNAVPTVVDAPVTNNAVIQSDASTPPDATAVSGATPPDSTEASKTPTPAVDTTSPELACTRAAFAPVWDAKSPSKAVVDEAIGRLTKCKPMMRPALYSDIQRRLIAKISE